MLVTIGTSRVNKQKRKSSRSNLFSLLDSDFVQIFGQIVSLGVNTLDNENLLTSRHIQRENKASLPVDVRRSITP